MYKVVDRRTLNRKFFSQQILQRDINLLLPSVFLRLNISWRDHRRGKSKKEFLCNQKLEFEISSLTKIIIKSLNTDFGVHDSGNLLGFADFNDNYSTHKRSWIHHIRSPFPHVVSLVNRGQQLAFLGSIHVRGLCWNLVEHYRIERWLALWFLHFPNNCIISHFVVSCAELGLEKKSSTSYQHLRYQTSNFDALSRTSGTNSWNHCTLAYGFEWPCYLRPHLSSC